MAQKANAQSENLERLLKESQIQVEAAKKEIEIQKVEKENIEKRVSEVFELFSLSLSLSLKHTHIQSLVYKNVTLPPSTKLTT